MRKYKLISALAEETAKDVVRNEEMHCWVNKGAKGIELIDELPDIFGQVWRLITAKRFRLREGQRSCLTNWQNTSRLQRWRSLESRR